MALSAGVKLGHYEIVSRLGAGGMGEVWLARDPRLNREVAIKVLTDDRLADEGRRRRFVQEAQAASSLNHPHIVTIHEIESDNGNDFIVMEYVRGKSLDTLIPRSGMRLSEVLRIAIPVADALAAAHARGIIHRDLKPANVMVGDRWRRQGARLRPREAGGQRGDAGGRDRHGCAERGPECAGHASPGPRPTCHRNRPPAAR